MNYSDLDSIIDYFKSTSSYYLIKKPNNLTVKYLIITSFILAFILAMVIYFFNNGLDIISLSIISLLISFFLIAFFLSRKITKRTDEYIKSYNVTHSLNLKKYDQVRFDIFYCFLLNNTINTLGDENFNILITYIKNQEENLIGDPNYNAKRTLITNSILAFIVSASSALTTKFITNSNQLIPFILGSSIIIGLIYTFLTSIIDFPNKISDEKDSYKILKTFLYKAKFKYNLEYQNDTLENTNSNLNSTKNDSHVSYEEKIILPVLRKLNYIK